MPLYEHVFLARQDISPQQVEALTETLKSVIEEGGGAVTKSEYWGLKSLAYRIKKNRKAHFTLFNLDSPHEAVAEMERQMSINEDVLRVLTLRVEEAEEGPSAMMRSRGGGRDRDERRGRRDERRPRDGDGDGGGASESASPAKEGAEGVVENKPASDAAEDSKE